MLGSFGNVVFEANQQKTLTFREKQHTKRPVWGTSSLIGIKPRSQFISPGQDEINFIIKLNAYIGVDPETEIEKLEQAAETGQTAAFILGGKPYGARNARWYIRELMRTDQVVDNEGKFVSIDANITLMEYH